MMRPLQKMMSSAAGKTSSAAVKSSNNKAAHMKSTSPGEKSDAWSPDSSRGSRSVRIRDVDVSFSSAGEVSTEMPMLWPAVKYFLGQETILSEGTDFEEDEDGPSDDEAPSETRSESTSMLNGEGLLSQATETEVVSDGEYGERSMDDSDSTCSSESDPLDVSQWVLGSPNLNVLTRDGSIPSPTPRCNRYASAVTSGSTDQESPIYGWVYQTDAGAVQAVRGLDKVAPMNLPNQPKSTFSRSNRSNFENRKYAKSLSIGSRETKSASTTNKTPDARSSMVRIAAQTVVSNGSGSIQKKSARDQKSLLSSTSETTLVERSVNVACATNVSDAGHTSNQQAEVDQTPLSDNDDDLLIDVEVIDVGEVDESDEENEIVFNEEAGSPASRSLWSSSSLWERSPIHISDSTFGAPLLLDTVYNFERSPDTIISPTSDCLSKLDETTSPVVEVEGSHRSLTHPSLNQPTKSASRDRTQGSSKSQPTISSKSKPMPVELESYQPPVPNPPQLKATEAPLSSISDDFGDTGIKPLMEIQVDADNATTVSMITGDCPPSPYRPHRHPRTFMGSTRMVPSVFSPGYSVHRRWSRPKKPTDDPPPPASNVAVKGSSQADAKQMSAEASPPNGRVESADRPPLTPRGERASNAGDNPSAAARVSTSSSQGHATEQRAPRDNSCPSSDPADEHRDDTENDEPVSDAAAQGGLPHSLHDRIRKFKGKRRTKIQPQAKPPTFSANEDTPNKMLQARVKADGDDMSPKNAICEDMTGLNKKKKSNPLATLKKTALAKTAFDAGRLPVSANFRRPPDLSRVSCFADTTISHETKSHVLALPRVGTKSTGEEDDDVTPPMAATKSNNASQRDSSQIHDVERRAARFKKQTTDKPDVATAREEISEIIHYQRSSSAPHSRHSGADERLPKQEQGSDVRTHAKAPSSGDRMRVHERAMTSTHSSSKNVSALSRVSCYPGLRAVNSDVILVPPPQAADKQQTPGENLHLYSTTSPDLIKRVPKADGIPYQAQRAANEIQIPGSRAATHVKTSAVMRSTYKKSAIHDGMVNDHRERLQASSFIGRGTGAKDIDQGRDQNRAKDTRYTKKRVSFSQIDHESEKRKDVDASHIEAKRSGDEVDNVSSTVKGQGTTHVLGAKTTKPSMIAKISCYTNTAVKTMTDAAGQTEVLQAGIGIPSTMASPPLRPAVQSPPNIPIKSPNDEFNKPAANSDQGRKGGIISVVSCFGDPRETIDRLKLTDAPESEGIEIVRRTPRRLARSRFWPNQETNRAPPDERAADHDAEGQHENALAESHVPPLGSSCLVRHKAVSWRSPAVLKDPILYDSEGQAIERSSADKGSFFVRANAVSAKIARSEEKVMLSKGLSPIKGQNIAPLHTLGNAPGRCIAPVAMSPRQVSRVIGLRRTKSLSAIEGFRDAHQSDLTVLKCSIPDREKSHVESVILSAEGSSESNSLLKTNATTAPKTSANVILSLLELNPCQKGLQSPDARAIAMLSGDTLDEMVELQRQKFRGQRAQVAVTGSDGNPGSPRTAFAKHDKALEKRIQALEKTEIKSPFRPIQGTGSFKRKKRVMFSEEATNMEKGSHSESTTIKITNLEKDASAALEKRDGFDLSGSSIATKGKEDEALHSRIQSDLTEPSSSNHFKEESTRNAAPDKGPTGSQETRLRFVIRRALFGGTAKSSHSQDHLALVDEAKGMGQGDKTEPTNEAEDDEDDGSPTYPEESGGRDFQAEIPNNLPKKPQTALKGKLLATVRENSFKDSSKRTPSTKSTETTSDRCSSVEKNQPTGRLRALFRRGHQNDAKSDHRELSHHKHDVKKSGDMPGAESARKRYGADEHERRNERIPVILPLSKSNYHSKKGDNSAFLREQNKISSPPLVPEAHAKIPPELPLPKSALPHVKSDETEMVLKKSGLNKAIMCIPNMTKAKSIKPKAKKVLVVRHVGQGENRAIECSIATSTTYGPKLLPPPGKGLKPVESESKKPSKKKSRKNTNQQINISDKTESLDNLPSKMKNLTDAERKLARQLAKDLKELAKIEKEKRSLIEEGDPISHGEALVRQAIEKITSRKAKTKQHPCIPVEDLLPTIPEGSTDTKDEPIQRIRRTNNKRTTTLKLREVPPPPSIEAIEQEISPVNNNSGCYSGLTMTQNIFGLFACSNGNSSKLM